MLLFWSKATTVSAFEASTPEVSTAVPLNPRWVVVLAETECAARRSKEKAKIATKDDFSEPELPKSHYPRLTPIL
jgi:hypothetical protein